MEWSIERWIFPNLESPPGRLRGVESMATTDYLSRRAFIKIIADSYSLGYKELTTCEVPQTDGNTVYMPVLSPEASNEEADRWQFGLLHECYHNKGDNKDDFDLIQKYNIDMKSLFGCVLNIVVDHNIEYKEFGIYEGADELLSDTYSSVISKYQEHLGEMHPLLAAVIAFDAHCRQQWLAIPDYKLQDSLSEKAKEFYDNLLKLESEYLEKRKGGEANFQLAKKIVECCDSSAEDLIKKAQCSPREGNGETGGVTGEEIKSVVKYKELSPHSDLPGQQKSSLTIEYDSDDFEDSESYVMDEELVEFPANYKITKDSIALLESTTFSLSNKLRNVLKVMSTSRWYGGKKRGKLKTKSLASLSAGNDAIFRLKENADILDTAVCVLVDSSGSMYGDKWEKAAQAALMVNDCLTKLHIPVEVLGFTTSRGSSCKHVVFSSFTSKVTNEELAAAFINFSEHMSCNNDGESLLWAFERLRVQKNKRKILIVISDGQPAGKQHVPGFTKTVVKDIEKSKNVELYAIGVEDLAVRGFYSNYKVINHTSELERALLDTLKQGLLPL